MLKNWVQPGHMNMLLNAAIFGSAAVVYNSSEMLDKLGITCELLETAAHHFTNTWNYFHEQHLSEKMYGLKHLLLDVTSYKKVLRK